jgi:hypothetical protein
MKDLRVLKVYDLFNNRALHEDEVNVALIRGFHYIHEVADIGCVDHFPLPVEPHKVLRLELAVVLVLKEKEPGRDYV